MSLICRAQSPVGYSWKCRDRNPRRSICIGSFLAKYGMSMQKVVTIMFYWVLYKLKCKPVVMLFEQIQHWDTAVNDNNFFCAECHNWLQNQQVHLGGFDANGQRMYVEVDETYFSTVSIAAVDSDVANG